MSWRRSNIVKKLTPAVGAGAFLCGNAWNFSCFGKVDQVYTEDM